MSAPGSSEIAYCAGCYDAVAEGRRIITVLRRVKCARCGKEPVIGHVPAKENDGD